MQSQEEKSKEADGRHGLRLSAQASMGKEHQKTEHDGGDRGGSRWGRRQEMLVKKTEQDTALERPGLMSRKDRGDRGMERAWGLE